MSVRAEDTNSRSKLPFLGDISSVLVAAHELKAPLSLMRQLSLSLVDEAATPGEQREIVHHMMLTTEKAIRLTTDLTQAHTLQTHLFECEPVNSQQLCEDVAYEMRPLYAAYGKEIRVRHRRQSLLTVANRDLLRRVMLNFADNALHYGAIDSPVELSASLCNGGDTIRLGVRDYGPAVPIDVLATLSHNQVQSVQQSGTRPASSGLGLYIAKQFAEAMNGTVGAIRHRDGATFYVDMQASQQLSFL